MTGRVLLAAAIAITLTACGPTRDEVNQRFLDEAAAEPGAIRTESGMVFLSLTEGTGVQPLATERVEVQYEGRFIDGYVFDDTEDDDVVEFPLDGVIACWTEGMQRIAEGGSAKLTCPPELAYGAQGYPGVIPGNAVLQFDVTLVDVLGR